MSDTVLTVEMLTKYMKSMYVKPGRIIYVDGPVMPTTVHMDTAVSDGKPRITKGELAMAIVRLGERFPDRVGLRGSWYHEGDHCLIGMVLHEADRRFNSMCFEPEAQALMTAAIGENDAGTPWGEIPKRLGLVPGEAPAELPGGEVVVADAEAVCVTS